MTLNDMAPAIGGALAAILGYLYAIHMRNKLREARRAAEEAMDPFQKEYETWLSLNNAGVKSENFTFGDRASVHMDPMQVFPKTGSKANPQRTGGR